MADHRLLIIVPAYNEAGNIGQTVREIQNFAVPVKEFQIVVIDDGSKDATCQEARATSTKVVRLPFNLGIGGAVQTGFRYALRHGFDLAVQIDGDGQHDVTFLPQLLAPVLKKEADIVVGSRFIGPYQGYRSSFVRRIGIHFFAELISWLTGFKITDPTSGFRLYNERAIRILAENYPQDYPEPESIVMAQRYGLKLLEVPVQMRRRAAGHSSIRYLMTLYYMIKVTLAIILRRLTQPVRSE